MKDKHKPYLLGALAVGAVLYGRHRAKKRAQATAPSASTRPSTPTVLAVGRM